MLLIPVSGGAGGLISKICCCSNLKEQSSASLNPRDGKRMSPSTPHQTPQSLSFLSRPCWLPSARWIAKISSRQNNVHISVSGVPPHYSWTLIVWTHRQQHGAQPKSLASSEESSVCHLGFMPKALLNEYCKSYEKVSAPSSFGFSMATYEYFRISFCRQAM